jgi:CheY-like chemotaxis protein
VNIMAVVVVIDDHDGIRKAMGRQLASAGHEVIEAADGVEGLARCRERMPALVVCDIFMPGMEGIETIRGIRRELAGTKIIAMSGSDPYQRAHYLKVAQEFGADAVLVKPWREAELLGTIDRLLSA